MWYGQPEDDEAVGAGDAEELGDVTLDLGHGRDVLQGDAGVDEVERGASPAGPGPRLALTRNSQAGNASFSRRAWSTIPAEMSIPSALLEARPERAREPADAAAEVERPLAARRAAERLGDREHVRDLGLARGEELVHVPAAALAARAGQHRPERVDLGQVLPVLPVPLEAHDGESVPAPDDLRVGEQLAVLDPHPRLQVARDPRLLDHEREQVRLPRQHAGDHRHDRAREAKHARARARDRSRPAPPAARTRGRSGSGGGRAGRTRRPSSRPRAPTSGRRSSACSCSRRRRSGSRGPRPPRARTRRRRRA